MEQGATFDNAGTFHNDAYDLGCGFYGGYSFHDTAGGTAPSIVNIGTFESELGSGHEAKVSVNFANEGGIIQNSGKLVIEDPITTERETQLGSENPSASGSPHSELRRPHKLRDR